MLVLMSFVGPYGHLLDSPWTEPGQAESLTQASRSKKQNPKP